MKKMNVLFTLILAGLIVFSCAMGQDGSKSSSGSKSKSSDEQVQVSDSKSTAPIVYKINIAKFVRIDPNPTLRLTFIDVTPDKNNKERITRHAVADDAKITLNGKKAKLNELIKGDNLTISYIADKNNTAKIIEAKRVIF